MKKGKLYTVGIFALSLIFTFFLFGIGFASVAVAGPSDGAKNSSGPSSSGMGDKGGGHGNGGGSDGKGNNGNHGNNGNNGNHGNNGNNGNHGNNGNNGNHGNNGNNGNNGHDGNNGNHGNNGHDGNNGNHGNNGHDGNNGNHHHDCGHDEDNNNTPAVHNSGGFELPLIQVINPSEKWVLIGGTEQTIEWRGYGNFGPTVDILLYTGNSLVRTIANNIPNTQHTYQWKTPSDLPPGPNYQIMVVSSRASGMSPMFHVK